MSQNKNPQRQNKTNTSRTGRYFAQRNDRMRKKMLYLGYQMGYDQPRNEAQRDLTAHEINLQNVSAWCESSKCSVKKPLKTMTGAEIKKALTQFELVYQSFLKSYAR